MVFFLLPILLGKNSSIVKAIENVPGIGQTVALAHVIAGNKEQAKRAACKSYISGGKAVVGLAAGALGGPVGGLAASAAMSAIPSYETMTAPHNGSDARGYGKTQRANRTRKGRQNPYGVVGGVSVRTTDSWQSEHRLAGSWIYSASNWHVTDIGGGDYSMTAGLRTYPGKNQKVMQRSIRYRLDGQKWKNKNGKFKKEK